MLDRLSPAASPGGSRSGVRRVNNLPLVILGAALLGFLLIMAKVAVDRAQQKTKTHEDPPKGGNANAFAQRLTSAYANGIIPPRNPSTAEPPRPEQEPPQSVPIVHVDLDRPPAPPASVRRQDQEVDRIRQIKQSTFEEAVKGPTSGAVSAWRGQVGTASPSKSESPQASQKNPAKEDRWRLASRPEAQETPFVLRTGFVIPAVMISAIHSQLAGPVIAQVSEPVFDSATGRRLLIPQGTRLVGIYSNDVAAGQERLFVAWQRLVFPDGQAMDLGELPGTSGAGLSGLSGEVDHHWVRIFGQALLMSVITAGATYSQQPETRSDSNGYGPMQSAGGTLSAALGQQLGAAGAAVLMKNLNLAPTLEVHAGYRLNVVATKDLTFDRPYRAFSTHRRR